ncbi:hypothetical protein PUN28_019959 [Cardiocondyla obscurior]|uniref:Secreted protein n=1 Tax=Cardiocondyla obscurior TaxID=286306 RepID=A0AAW2EC46_9HYME
MHVRDDILFLSFFFFFFFSRDGRVVVNLVIYPRYFSIISLREVVTIARCQTLRASSVVTPSLDGRSLRSFEEKTERNCLGERNLAAPLSK